MDDGPHRGLPALDASADEEIGIVLLGLDAERLLAGLGLSCDDPGRDPALVALAVDRARHGAVDGVTLDDLVRRGTHHWTTWRPVLADAGLARIPVGSVRERWAAVASRTAHLEALAERDAATRIHLTACWLRRADVDRCAVHP
ncbi:DUF6187 family protein [Actinomycetospora atypica]|uniref:DUF6187 family protein n=1 Tax=Actinomycetospora atypica TaxID=1290095 RepID=A0ABV9YQT4_9PSEU